MPLLKMGEGLVKFPSSSCVQHGMIFLYGIGFYLPIPLPTVQHECRVATVEYNPERSQGMGIGKWEQDYRTGMRMLTLVNVLNVLLTCMVLLQCGEMLPEKL